MSFTFRTLSLENWLAYSGQTTIRFPEFEPGRNLIVIHGRNGYGKTSLLRALRYVFEGERLSRDELLSLWHQKASEEGQRSFEVALEFTYGQRACKIVRGCDFRQHGSHLAHKARVELFFDGKRQEEMVEDKIQEILPRDCLDFVFFDGAEISRYALDENKQDTREAIEKILGIPACRNLRDDLGDLIKSLEREQQHLLEESGQAKTLLLEIDELEEELERYRERRSSLAVKKRSSEEVRADLEAEREQIRAIESDLVTLQEKQRRRAYLDERIGEVDAQMRGIVAQLPLFMLEGTLRQIVEELRAKEHVSPRAQALDARLRTLMQLVEESECLCGRQIDVETRAKLEKQLQSLEDLLGDRAASSQGPSEQLQNLDALLLSLRARRFDPDELIDRRAELDTEREEVEVEIERLKKRLKDHPDATVADISQQLGQVGQQIQDLVVDLRSLDQNLARKEQDLIELKRELDQLGVVVEQARGVTRTLQEAHKASAAIAELLDAKVAAKRSAIEAKATEVFRKITNKPKEYDRLELRDDYSLRLVQRDGSTASNQQISAGEKEVVAYSFITALNLTSADPAPFVMDTPFGHLDEGHRRGLLTSLPELQVQAFLLATDRDLPPSERDSIDSSLAKEFVLKRDQQRGSTSIEGDGA